MQIDNSTYFSKKITFLNVLLTFSMVVLHAKTPERWGLPLDMSNPFIYMVSLFTQNCVPMFFFISGLLFYRNCEFKGIERKLHSRIRSLFIPYILWNVLFVGIFFVLTHIPFIHDKMNMGDVLSTPTEIIYVILNARYTVLWFVKDLMIFCLLSAGIHIALHNKITAFIVLIFFIINALTGNYGYESIFMWLPMYFSGAIVGRFYARYDESVSIHSSIDGIMKNKIHRYCFVAMLIVVYCLLYFLSVTDTGYIFYYRLFSPVILWILTDFLLKRYLTQNFQVKSWMRYMFFIYCTHHFLLNILQKFIVLTYPPSPLVLNLTFVISPVIVIVILIQIAKFLSRYKFYAYLSGGR